MDLCGSKGRSTVHTTYHVERLITMDAESAELQRKLQGAVDNMLDSIDKQRMRPIQKKAYLCSAGCFDSKTSSQQQLQNCIDQCTSPVQHSQNVIQNEMQMFQDRLKRCADECQSDANMSITPEVRTNPSLMDSVQKKTMKCLSVCVDRNLSLIRTVQSRIESEIDKHK